MLCAKKTFHFVKRSTTILLIIQILTYLCFSNRQSEYKKIERYFEDFLDYNIEGRRSNFLERERGMVLIGQIKKDSQ